MSFADQLTILNEATADAYDKTENRREAIKLLLVLYFNGKLLLQYLVDNKSQFEEKDFYDRYYAAVRVDASVNKYVADNTGLTNVIPDELNNYRRSFGEGSPLRLRSL